MLWLHIFIVPHTRDISKSQVIFFVILESKEKELLPSCVVEYTSGDTSFNENDPLIDPLLEQSSRPNENLNSSSKSESDIPELEGGLTVMTSVFFVVGDVIGAGVVALPYAMKLVSYLGLPLFIMCSTLMCYCAVLLAQSCAKIMKTIDRNNLRDPYPRLGLEAAGKPGKYITTFSLAVNQVLTCIVFILLAGEIFLELFPSSPWDHFSYRLQLRIWFCICGAFLLPFTFLGTPKDFKGIGFMAMATSGLAVVMIAIMLGYLAPYPVDNDKSLKITVDGFLHSFGTILFGFGGVSIFPTIQNDMKEPEKFVKSVTFGYLIVASIYVTLPLASYIILGDIIREDLLTTLSYLELYFTNHMFRTMCMVAQACICGHVMCAFVLNVNPVYQQFEGFIGIPTSKYFFRDKLTDWYLFFIKVHAFLYKNSIIFCEAGKFVLLTLYLSDLRPKQGSVIHQVFYHFPGLTYPYIMCLK